MNIHSLLNVIIRPFRKKRMRHFMASMQLQPTDRILDVGGTPFNWTLVNCTNPVTLLNLPDPVQTRPLMPENFTFVDGDGTQLRYADASFDVCFSNSVIEHVGDLQAQRRFAAEVCRCGKGVWIQTPARSFFFEPHYLAPFLHWLPAARQKKLLRYLSGWGLITRPSPQEASAFVDQTRLLTLPEMRALFPDCDILEEKFLGMTKAFVAFRKKAS